MPEIDAVNVKRRSLLVSTDFIQKLCIAYISIWAISPPLAYGTLYRLFAIAATVLWILIELIKRHDTFLKPTFPTFCALLFIIYAVIIGILDDGMSDVIRNLQTYICLLFLIFFESYRRRDIRQLRVVFWISLILHPVWIGITLNALNEQSHIARLLTRSSLIAEEATSQGVGGFALVYSALIALPILLYMVKTSSYRLFPEFSIFQRWLIKGLLIINLLLSCALIVKAGYSIALILMIISIIITFVGGMLTYRRLFMLSGIALILMILSFSMSSKAIDYIEKISVGTSYMNKIRDIKESLVYLESVGALGDRTERYGRSIRLFVESPVLGSLAFKDLGKHSAIIDRFARYGVIVGLMFMFTIFYLPFYYLKYSGRALGMTFAVAFVVISASFLNNIFIAFGFMLFMFYPASMSYIAESRRI